jgi:hypothetical protein
VLSLTPFWCLSILGVFAVLVQPNVSNGTGANRYQHWLMVGAMVATTAVVLIFYFSRGLEDRNYGGITSGLRWTFWLIPIWFWLANESLKLQPGATARRVIDLMLMVSVFSACFPWKNPWTSPWLMQLMEYLKLPV